MQKFKKIKQQGLDLLVENDGTMSPEKGPENENRIEDYKLIEWKVR